MKLGGITVCLKIKSNNDIVDGFIAYIHLR